MATTTITFSQFSNNLKAVHTGIVAAGGHVSVSTTVCPSTVLNMVQVPNGATLVDWWYKIKTGGANQTFQIGTSFSPSGIMKLTTLCTTFSISTQSAAPALDGSVNNAPGGPQGGDMDFMPVRISLSDDAQPANIWVQGRVGVACSASAYFTFMLFYTMDGLAGRTTLR